MICITCGAYFKQSRFNETLKCEMCLDDLNDIPVYESVYEADVTTITNPSGKTKPVFLDEVQEPLDRV